MNNSILHLTVFKHQGLWVFDDDRVGLKAEKAGLNVQWLYEKLKLTGKMTEFDENGNKKWIWNYKDGKRHGRATWFYENGKAEVDIELQKREVAW